MISKIIQYTGIAIIVMFSAISIFFSLAQREIEDPQIQKIMAYTSFFEDRFYDMRMKMTLDKGKVDDRIVLASIDDNSLTQIGRWPWSRTIWKDVIGKMQHYGAKVIAFDVFFSEPEKACNAESPDIVMARSLSDFQTVPGNKVIIPYSLTDFKQDGYPEVPDVLYNFIMDTKQAPEMNLKAKWVGKNVFPIEEIASTEVALGHIGVEEDPDGIFRHYPVVANVETLYFPSFALMAYQLYTGDSPVLEMLTIGEHKLKMKSGTLSLNFKGEAKVRWFGARNNFPEVSIYNILQAKPDDKEMHKKLNGKIVMVGSTAFAAHDLRHTPVDPMLPGIYFHMNMTHMLLDGLFYVPEADSTLYSWILLLSGTLIIIIVMMFGNAILDLFMVNAIAIGFFLLDTYVLLPKGYEIKLFFAIFSPVACYSWSTFLHFYLASKEKKYIKGTFSRFVAPAIVDQMLANPDKVKVGGEKKNITVFFSDVRDFTSISEKLTPEQLSTCLNQYMGVMTDILFENYGTLDKYIGDAIVAYWGAPLDVENHAYHAVQAALKMIDALPEVNRKFEEQGFPLFEHGIGLNTGDCSVGNMGSDKIFSYTALGDNMNLGARAEALCKYYGVQLNITEYTKDAIPPELQKEFKFRILDKVRVKGKEIPVTLWEVLDRAHCLYEDQEGFEAYMEAFQSYQNQEFERGARLLKPLVEKYPHDKSCKRVLEFCEGFIKMPPPPDWDGVFTHTTKG
ncbi:MAG: CHASE2 domain-containing protein [Deltaproteobacteria bacterium]|nr:MAG: CHASE2 domain-containing protein [Deltaproteobacteria bacterium]